MSRVQSRGSRVKVEVEGKSRVLRVKVEGRGYLYFFPFLIFFIYV